MICPNNWLFNRAAIKEALINILNSCLILYNASADQWVRIASLLPWNGFVQTQRRGHTHTRCTHTLMDAVNFGLRKYSIVKMKDQPVHRWQARWKQRRGKGVGGGSGGETLAPRQRWRKLLSPPSCHGYSEEQHVCLCVRLCERELERERKRKREGGRQRKPAGRR